jgi:hypothetical protein
MAIYDWALGQPVVTNDQYEWVLGQPYIVYYSEEEGWANIAKVNGVTATDLAKVLGIAVADIAKVNGVAV